MTHCTPHYPVRRWDHCCSLLPASAGVRVLVAGGGARLHWYPLHCSPYVRDFRGRGLVFFPRCYRRGVPNHRGWRW